MCYRQRMTAKEPVLARVRPEARDKEITPCRFKSFFMILFQRKHMFKEAQTAPLPPRLDSLGVCVAVALVLSAKSGSNEAETF